MGEAASRPSLAGLHAGLRGQHAGRPLVGKYKYEQRWGDEEFAIEVFDRLGIHPVGRVEKGAVEGGDSWMLDETTLVIGSGNRSTLRGIENAAASM